MHFEWNPEKNASNRERHGISFDEASTAFFDPLSSTIADPRHSEGEFRFISIGLNYGVRGKYQERLKEGSKVVVLDPDVAAEFASPQEVNRALRVHLKTRKDAQGAA